MKRTLIALALGALAVAGWPTTQLLAQETKMARGTVTALAADSVTVKVGDQEMKFGVDSKTNVEATGAGTAARQAQAAGKPGPKLTDVMKVGQPVAVSYTDMGGSLHATRIRRGRQRRRLGRRRGAGHEDVQRHREIDRGDVDDHHGQQRVRSDVHADVHDRRDHQSHREGRRHGGRGGRRQDRGHRPRRHGDKVSVSYHATGNTLHAAEIRVTGKAAPAK